VIIRAFVQFKIFIDLDALEPPFYEIPLDILSYGIKYIKKVTSDHSRHNAAFSINIL
jgi:hypothetical protein